MLNKKRKSKDTWHYEVMRMNIKIQKIQDVQKHCALPNIFLQIGQRLILRVIWKFSRIWYLQFNSIWWLLEQYQICKWWPNAFYGSLKTLGNSPQRPQREFCSLARGLNTVGKIQGCATLRLRSSTLDKVDHQGCDNLSAVPNFLSFHYQRNIIKHSSRKKARIQEPGSRLFFEAKLGKILKI